MGHHALTTQFDMHVPNSPSNSRSARKKHAPINAPSDKEGSRSDNPRHKRSKVHRSATTCAVCKETFYPKRNATTCSDKCRKSLSRKRHSRGKRYKSCAFCGASFEVKNKRHRYCDASCRQLAHRHRRAGIALAFSEALGVPLDFAQDELDRQDGMREMTKELAYMGVTYSDRHRRWV